MESFKINSIWRDRFGRYKINFNDGNEIKAIYLDGEKVGQTKSFSQDSADIILRIHENILFEEEQKIKESLGLKTRKAKRAKSVIKIDDDLQHKYYFTLGFLAKNGFISMRTVPNTENRDGNRYNNTVGIYPWEEIHGYTFDDHPDTRSTKIYVSFNEKPDLLELLYFPGELVFNENVISYYDTEWCWMLIEERGFRLGHANDVNLIKEFVPDNYISAFEEGFLYE